MFRDEKARPPVRFLDGCRGYFVVVTSMDCCNSRYGTKRRINFLRHRTFLLVPYRRTPKGRRLAAWFQHEMTLLNPTAARLSSKAENHRAPDPPMSSSPWNIITKG
jgi:hypothetical protein